MSTLTAMPQPAAPVTRATPALIRTARATGAWYLAIGVTGMLGFLVIRPQLFDPDSASATYANLTNHAALAQLSVALELGIVVTQAVLAVWFYKLFRAVNDVAAIGILVFGMANAVAIMASATFMGTALSVANDASLAGLDGSSTVQLLWTLSANAWGAGAVFFGLWLIPMGWAVLGSRFAPRPLGWLLIGGGVGYIASAVVIFAVPDASATVETILTLPATAGEFWMIGYLLIRGVRRTKNVEVTR